MSGRRESAESWFPIILRYTTLSVGVVILLSQQFGIGPSDIALKVAGIACFGPTVAQSAATIFASIRGGSDGKER